LPYFSGMQIEPFLSHILSSVTCLSVCAIFLPYYLINDTIYGGEGREVVQLQMCFDFPYTFVWNIPYSKKNSTRNYKCGSQDFVDRIVTTVWTGPSGLWIPAGVRDFFFCFQNRVYGLCGPRSLIFHAYRGSVPGVTLTDLMLATHLHLFQRSKMSGVVSLPPALRALNGVNRDNFTFTCTS